MAKQKTIRQYDNIQDYVIGKWNDHYQFNRANQQDYYNNVAFYEGYQYVYYDTNLSGYTESPIEDEATQRLYLVSNLIKPLADTRIAMILGERPMLEVISNDKSAETINKAERDTNILKALWEDLNVQSLLAYGEWWSVLCNQCFLRPYFDPNYGKQISNPDYDKEIARFVGEAGEEYKEKEFYNMGRINIDLFTPFEVIHDTVHKPWSNVMRYGWVLVKNIVSIDDLYSRHKKSKVDKIKPKSTLSVSTADDQLLMLRDRNAYKSMRADKKRKGENRNVEVYEYYEAPNNDFPGGLHLVLADGDKDSIILYDSRDANETFDRIPIVRIKDQVGDKKSLVSGSRQKQKQYNLVMSKIIELSRFPTLYGLPEGIDTSAMMGKAYEIFNYDEDMGAPVIIEPRGPTDVLLFLKHSIETDLEHHWGIHEITARATPPSKGMSGRSIFLLQEGDKSRLSTVLTMLSESLSDLGELLLGLAKKHYREPRTLNYKLESGRFETIDFKGADISEKYKVSVQMTSEFKRNKQAYQQFVVQLLGVIGNIPAIQGILNDPVVMRKILSYFDEGLANTLLVRNQDMAIQERENRELMAGESPEVKPWHKHNTHIQVMMSGLLNTKEFMDKDGNEQQAIVQAHLVPHLQYMQKGMESQMQAQQGLPPQGQPGGGTFQQGEAPPVDPLTAIDRLAEGRVQPDPGAYGTEETM